MLKELHAYSLNRKTYIMFISGVFGVILGLLRVLPSKGYVY